MIKVEWHQYWKTIAIILSNVLLTTVWVVLSVAIHPLVLFSFAVNMLTFLFLTADGARAPDWLHMNNKHEYIIEDIISYSGSDVYVKLWPGIWVKTRYQVKDMAEFMEKKIDYQHKMKESFKI